MKEKRECVMGERLVRTIITIIVLTSISGGCAATIRVHEIDESVPMAQRKEAGIIVNSSYIKVADVEEEKEARRQEEEKASVRIRHRNIEIYFTHVDDQSIKDVRCIGRYPKFSIDARSYGNPTAVELTPGGHKIRFRTKMQFDEWWRWSVLWGWEGWKPMGSCVDMQETELLVQPHEVYIVLVDEETEKRTAEETTRVILLGEHGKWGEGRTMYDTRTKIIKTKYTYDQETGIAHHPTDSKHSFKVK